MTVTDTVTNLSAEPGELELLYHVNFGVPLLGPGAKLVAAGRQGGPARRRGRGQPARVGHLRAGDPGRARGRASSIDLAAGTDGQTQALLRNAAGDQGASLTFNKKQLPCFTLWKNRQAAVDGYVTGLEPAINFPNCKSFEKEKGRVVVLAPGASRTFQVTLTAHADAESVAKAKTAVERLQEAHHAGSP